MEKPIPATPKPISNVRPTRMSLTISLLRTREVIMEELRPILHAMGITEQQWRVIRVVAEEGEADATTIADRACILAPSLTRILRTLAEKGYIEMRKDKVDGRRMVVHLTDEGYAFAETVSPQTAATLEEMREIVGDEKWEQLLELLADFRTEVGQSKSS